MWYNQKKKLELLAIVEGYGVDEWINAYPLGYKHIARQCPCKITKLMTYPNYIGIEAVDVDGNDRRFDPRKFRFELVK